MSKTILKIFLSCFFFFAAIQIKAQMNESALITNVREIDLNSIAYDPANPKMRNTVALTYAEVEGSPFWNEKWNTALLFFNNGSKAKINQAKLNLYTNEIHYLTSSGDEMAVDNTGITRLVFLNNSNSLQVNASFAVLVNHLTGNGTAYYRVFNAGLFQLILLEKQLIKTSPYDPLLGKSISSFYTKKNYAIYNEGKIIPLEELNKKSIQLAFPNDAKAEKLLNENKSKLKSEKDIIDFLNAYNSLAEKKN